jgi:hypothetical protein
MASQPRILIIGFGGTGHEALLQAKLLFNQWPGRVPAHVGFFYLDTVAPKGRGEASLRDVESALLLLRDPSEMLRNPDNAYIREWFPNRISVQTAVHGAAQIRPLGRLALHAQPERVLTQLGNCLDTLTDRTRLREVEDGDSLDEQGSIEVYFLSSLCGGTGSGIMIDVAKLIREQLSDAPTVRFVGVFLLPGPFRRLGGTSMVKANAYAALKEIDYLANPRTRIDFSFGASRQFVLDRSPFDLVYLVDSVGERFDTTTNVQQLARQMAYLPYLMSTPSFGPQVREILHNLIPQLEAKDLVQDKRATYASFGVATLEIPPSSVSKAMIEFECELLSQLLADTQNVPELQDIGVQVALDKCAVKQLPETLEMLLLEFDFRNPREPIDKLTEIFAAAVGLVEEYARRHCEPSLRALRESGERAIQGLVRDASLHPGRIASTLRECARLQRYLNGVLEAVRAENKVAQHAEKERRRAWDLCQQAFKSRRRRLREPAALDWRNIVNSLVLPARLSGSIDDFCVDALGYLIDQVREAEEWCSTAMKNVRETLGRVSAEQVVIEKPPSPFTRYCDAATIRPRANAARFLEGLVDPKVWLGGSEPDIRSMISSFTHQQFELAFASDGSSSATRLVLADLHNSIAELRRFSDPLWSYTADKIPPNHHRGIHHIEVLGVDALSGEVQSIVGQYPTMGCVATKWWDRVVHLQIRAGVPLFALTCMDELWRDYVGLSDGESRGKYHIDQRWAGWPELLQHAFDKKVINVFAQGLASSQIFQSGSVFEYTDQLTNGRVLGESFLQTYHTLSADNQLVAAISSSMQKWSANGNSKRKAKAEELWELLLQDRVPFQDRAVVEALIRSLERPVNHKL